MAVKIVLKNSSTEDKRPTPGQLENGEIALNYHEAGSFLTCKDREGNIHQVGGVKISEVAPDNPVKQTLWFQPSSLILFIYDGDSFLPVAGSSGGGTAPGTDLGIDNRTGVDLEVTSTTGQDATVPAATALLAGLMTAADKVKVDAIPNNLDDRYLKLAADAGDQTVASTDKTTFEGIIDAASGVRLTSGPSWGGAADVEYGIFKNDADDNISIAVSSQLKASFKKDIIIFRGTDGDPCFNSATQYTSINSKTTTVSASTLNLNSEVDKADATGHNIIFANAPIYTNVANNAILAGVQINNPQNNSSATGVTFYGYAALNCTDKFDTNIGYRSQLANGSKANFNFFADGAGPNFFAGNTYIGGTTARNTRELWESTLTEEQKEQLAARTLAIPASVSQPGDGIFARQWWYEQQSAEDQALIDSGELNYPTHLAAATFNDTFALGDNTKINLISNGKSTFRSEITVEKRTPIINFLDVSQATNERNILLKNAGGALTVQATDDAGAGGGNLFKFNRSNKDITSFTGEKNGNTWFTVDNVNKEVTVDGKVTFNDGVEFSTAGVSAYFTGEISGGGTYDLPNWSISASGQASGITVTRASVVTDEQAGTVETLIDIITDLRARLEALESAAGGASVATATPKKK